jgi:tRNA(Ile)-lysidine synthetase-like protein
MENDLPRSGSYVVAVSGGVDSVVLLHLLSKQKELDLVVAHFDHGIRNNSAVDRKFVEKLATSYNLPFVFEEGNLGPTSSEAEAREARYGFLRKVQASRNAQALVTAHHQDDYIETAILNMLRGTGRKGLTALKSRPDIIRPLLSIPKAELVKYAQSEGLEWREDPTNKDDTYLRNYVRHNIMPRFSSNERTKLLSILVDLEHKNQETDALLADVLSQQVGGKLERQWFTQLPHSVAKEMMASWLRLNGVASFDRKGLERLVIASKTGAAGKRFPVKDGVILEVNKDNLALT